MIRDRGRIKWTAMMLPEHVKMLRDWMEEDQKETKKELDEQQFEVMNAVMLEAMELNQFIAVTYYHHDQYELMIGKIHKWNFIDDKVQIVDRFGERYSIDRSRIADVRIVNEY